MKTQAFDITVGKGSGNFNSSAVYDAQKNQDIHDIKTGNVNGHDESDLFYGSGVYWTILALILASSWPC